ncbi:MAG: penicillin-binding protein 2 [Rhodospirillaceae bacterium]|nr:penicillin-binding protein 2 [Rhodospirillaceae bacterium]
MIGAITNKRRTFHYPGEDVRPARTTKVLLEGATKRVIETGRSRLIVTAGLFGLAFAGIGARLVDLMVLNDVLSPGGTVRTAPKVASVPVMPSHRAEIVDRNGILIATNLPTVNLYADAQKLPKDLKQAAEKLSATLPDLHTDDVFHKLSSGGRFIYLRRHLTPAEQMAVNRLGIPGVYFEDSQRRTYPHGSLFAHVVGATDPDNKGNAGVEKTFDAALRSQPEPLALSLDVRIQHAARESLAEGIARFNAAAGSAVVMDVRDGSVLAMVSLPDYDPKSPGTANDEARFNRVTLGLYEMGSTFKLFTAAMALEEGTATLDSRYDASVPIKIGRFTINDYHAQNRWLTVPEIMIHSSNIGAAKMALDAGTERQKAFLRKLGLLTQAPLELPEVGTPQYPRTWRDINTITISYGHGVSVTPINTAVAVSSLVNGGVLYPATVIKHTADQRPEGRQVISQKTSDAMRALMRLIVLEGSGKQADVKGYLVGGKTGSAEKVSSRGGYSEKSLRTSFISAFPIDAPRYVVLVVLDEPKAIKATYGFATAGWNAAPTAGNIIAKIAPMLGVFPVGHTDQFQPLAGLIAARGALHEKNEYAAAAAAIQTTAVQTTATTIPADSIGTVPAVARTPLPDNGEADITRAPEENDSIGTLIDTIGDDGEAE